MSFVTDGKGNVTNHIHINLKSNEMLDAKGFHPFAEIVDGMFVIDRLYDGYSKPGKERPDRKKVDDPDWAEYIKNGFPKLSYIESTALGGHDPMMDAYPQDAELIPPIFLTIAGISLLVGVCGWSVWNIFVLHTLPGLKKAKTTG